MVAVPVFAHVFPMYDLTLPFIISQVAITIAMGLDFLSLQYKKREHIFLCLIVSASLWSVHFFLLNKYTAGVIMLISLLRFILCYFTTNKVYIVIFIIVNTISLFFTYKDPTDLIIYVAILILIIGSFQKEGKRMRKMMMGGSSVLLLYSAIIFSPMGVISEAAAVISGFVGYYRHEVKNNKRIQKL